MTSSEGERRQKGTIHTKQTWIIIPVKTVTHERDPEQRRRLHSTVH